jgi:hypothetical protein
VLAVRTLLGLAYRRRLFVAGLAITILTFVAMFVVWRYERGRQAASDSH